MSRFIGSLNCSDITAGGEVNVTTGNLNVQNGSFSVVSPDGGSLDLKSEAKINTDAGNIELKSTSGNIVLESTSGSITAGSNVDFQSTTSTPSGFKIVGLQDPSGELDAANKRYVDAISSGFKVKESCVAASVANHPATAGAGFQILTGTSAGVLVVDGQSTSVGQRVLIKAQADATQNGIYMVTDPGTAGTPFVITRTTDANSAEELTGALTFVTGGNTLDGTIWFCEFTNSDVLGTDDVVWVQFGQTVTYTAGDGLQLTGSVFSALPDPAEGTITSAAAGLSVNEAADYLFTGSNFTINSNAATVGGAATTGTSVSATQTLDIELKDNSADDRTLNIVANNAGSGSAQIDVAADDFIEITTDGMRMDVNTQIIRDTLTYRILDPVFNEKTQPYAQSTRFEVQQATEVTSNAIYAIVSLSSGDIGTDITAMITVRSVRYALASPGVNSMSFERQGLFYIDGSGNFNQVGVSDTLSVYKDPTDTTALTVAGLGTSTLLYRVDNPFGTKAFWRSHITIDLAKTTNPAP